MSQDIERLYNDILSDQVPINWKSVMYNNNRPMASFITDLVKRVAFI